MKIRYSFGFSLLEVMVAVGILAFTITGLMASFIACNLSIQSNHNLLLASTYAQYVFEKMKKETFDNITTGSYNLSPYFNVNLDRANINNNLTLFTVNVTWYEREKEKKLSLITYRHKNQ